MTEPTPGAEFAAIIGEPLTRDAPEQQPAFASVPRRPRPDTSQGSGANGKSPTAPAAAFVSFLQDHQRHYRTFA